MVGVKFGMIKYRTTTILEFKNWEYKINETWIIRIFVFKFIIIIWKVIQTFKI